MNETRLAEIEMMVAPRLGKGDDTWEDEIIMELINEVREARAMAGAMAQ